MRSYILPRLSFFSPLSLWRNSLWRIYKQNKGVKSISFLNVFSKPNRARERSPVCVSPPLVLTPSLYSSLLHQIATLFCEITSVQNGRDAPEFNITYPWQVRATTSFTENKQQKTKQNKKNQSHSDIKSVIFFCCIKRLRTVINKVTHPYKLSSCNSEHFLRRIRPSI